RRAPTPYTPIWLMRQAGRYLPEYRAMRERYGFLELARNPEAAAEVTLQPVDRLGVDAAILFADILLIVEPLGVGLEFGRGEGPQIQRPLRGEAQIAHLTRIDVDAAVPFVFETVRRVRQALAGRVPLIGFAGAPFTVASYLVEGGPSRALIRALTPGAPVIHFGTGTASLLPLMRAAGGDVVGLDWRVDLDTAWTSVGHDVAVQGNLDPAVLLAGPPYIRQRVKDILDRAGGRPGHIFNLGHGVLPETPVEHVLALVDIVHELSDRRPL